MINDDHQLPNNMLAWLDKRTQDKATRETVLQAIAATRIFWLRDHLATRPNRFQNDGSKQLTGAIASAGYFFISRTKL